MTPERWKRTEKLYHEARAKREEERADYLIEACRDDDALRSDVESLLHELHDGDPFLKEPAHLMAEHIVAHLAGHELIGRTIAGYHVHGLLGAGGMGEVYRASDTTLKREVAIKILPHSVGNNADRRGRFEREAHILASLNHPHICAIHGLHEADGFRFLVLELVSGQTLQSVLAEGSRQLTGSTALPIRQVLVIAAQIAGALEAAHERGVVHRDLKPSNVMITPDASVKILDFGLAKTLSDDGTAVDAARSPGRTNTLVGAVMGTSAYMSPEQASGQPADRRSDIWAFGIVLFEMLAGRLPFTGSTVNETLASVLKCEPDWTALPDSINPELRRLIRLCLRKDPKRRLQSIGDARVQIEDLLAGESDEPTAVPDTQRGRSAVMPWLATGVAVIALLSVVAWVLRSAPLPVTRLGFVLPAGQRFDASGSGHIMTLSPLGDHIAFVGSPPGIYVRSMAQEDVKLIQGTEGHGSVREPAFSPDGGSIVFFASADQTLKRIPVTGGVPVTICPAKSPYGISWGADGIVFGQTEGIMRVSADPGAPVALVSVKSDELAHGPQMLPDGEHVLFTLATGTATDRWDKAQIVVQSVKSGERVTVINAGSDGRYLPSGHLVYAIGGRVFAVRFDEDRLVTAGDPMPIVEGVRQSAGNWSGAANVSVANNGSLAYIPGPVTTRNSLSDIALVDRQTGAVSVLNLAPGRYTSPRVSPDDERLAFAAEDREQSSVWTYELAGSRPMQRLTERGNNRYPVWISSSTVAFQSDRDGDLAIFRQTLGGSAERVTRPDAGSIHAPESWSESTNTLLYSVAKGRELSLWTLSLADGKRTPFAAVTTTFETYAAGGAFSPDGKWVAYGSAERGATTIYVKPFPASDALVQLPRQPTDGPHEPVWSRDGKELFYNPRVDGFEAVSVTTQPTFVFGKPVALPRKLRMGPPGTRTSYDITRSGAFVGLVTAGRADYDGGSEDRIQVVLNWLEAARARLAVQ